MLVIRLPISEGVMGLYLCNEKFNLASLLL